ncbi:energy transducer TonB [Kaistella jeonii]|uniref:TonB C-terminal domain-containing protein n=1 Tax=Kaistella jeonii TaxID=266749 RepID=A0A0C1FBN9_9FLAO|nr:energy transducer TonB [Kaistella jeonii]KIA89298.1 hypothetical protein OA86_06775 [Kaistella jeonii]SFC02181.1 TonB protein C-terminal [Kaistella jeonii]VEI96610.1 Gram-negative bacterial tonB protein [Kaistella jeonii]
MLKFSLFFSLISSFLFSQDIRQGYPPNQTSYIGGDTQFYKDFHEVLLDKKLQTCPNKDENISFLLVVYPDKTIKYVKPADAEFEESKCTFELTKEVLKYLDGWNPAEFDGKKIAATTSFTIIPDELFGELKEGYDPIKDMELAMYEGGIENFRKKVSQSINLTNYNFSGILRLEVTFVIERDGSMSTVQLAHSSGLKEFDTMILRTISRIKNKWTPAKIHGKPIRFRFRLPLAFSM